MAKSVRYSPEVQNRAVKMIFDHETEHESQWAAICSISSKIGCTPETLRKWVRRTETDEGRREGPTSEDRKRLNDPERENRELKRANKILRKASAYFEQKAREKHPEFRPLRSQYDGELRPHIMGVWFRLICSKKRSGACWPSG